jgi:predicted dehydrogenase
MTFFDEVYDSIANDKEEPVTGQDGLRVMQIIEAAIQSSAQKKQSIYR